MVAKENETKTSDSIFSQKIKQESLFQGEV